jgi:hypothetical protein
MIKTMGPSTTCNPVILVQKILQVCDGGEGEGAGYPAEALQGGRRPRGEGKAQIPGPPD